VDLERVRSHVERIAWVESASVRRIWPDRLQVRVVEQSPLARWGEQALLNQRGEIFQPEKLPQLPELVLLKGPDSSSVTVSREFQRIQVLLASVGVELAELEVDARQAWRLVTRSGLEVNLGRQSVMQRLTRFAQIHSRLVKQDQARPSQVDLRYTNGFTVRWEEQPELQSHRESPADSGSRGRVAGI